MATLTKTLLPISGYNNQYYTYQCTVIENSYSVANNTSNVTINFSIKGPWSPSFYEWATYYGIVVDGAVKKTGSSSPYISTSYVQLLSWTGDIAHNTDGSKSINVGVYLYNTNPSNYLPTQYSSSSTLSMGSVILTTIPRASTITSVNNITLGNTCNVKWTPASTGFKYKIKFSLGNWNYTTDFISPNTTSAYAYTGYTIPNTSSLLDDIPNSVTGTMTATLTTYNSSGTQIGSSSSKTFTVTVPSSVVPTVGTITLDPVNITTLDGTSRNLLVQRKNKLNVSVSGCSAGTGSSIKSYTFSGPNLSITTTSTSVTSNIVTSSGTLTYTVKVTDARGRTATKTATITCYAYTAPYIKLSSVYRCDSSGTKDDNGTYANCGYTLGYSSVNGTNKVTVKIMYKKNTATSYSSVIAISNGTTTSGSKILSSIDTASTYTVYATITDQYGSSSQCSTENIFSIAKVFNVRPDGTGIALGKMAESNNMLDVKWPIRTDEPEKTMVNLTYRGKDVVPDGGDNVESWTNLGNLATVYYTQNGILNTQPASYGFVLNITSGQGSTQVHQLWAEQAFGSLYHRGGNISGGFQNWRTVFDNINYTSYVTPKPTVLYNNDSNSAFTVTLSDSAANYSILEIFYRDNHSGNDRKHIRNSARIYNPNGRCAELALIEPNVDGDGIYVRSSLYNISEKTISVYKGNYTSLQNSHAVSVTNNNYIYITQVLGYK